MASEASQVGLLLNSDRLEEVMGRRGSAYTPASPGQPHNSIKGLWNLAEFVPKARYNRAKKRTEQRMNLYRRRTMPADACVHDVAWSIPGYVEGHLPGGAMPLSKKRWDFEA
jgi:hypothetical protein